jgi:uracil phosphoribosyltransferase
MDKLIVMDHPLVKHKLGIIRNKDTQSKEFREAVSEIATMLCYEATKDLPIENYEITTPMAKTTVGKIGCSVTVVPILRAGLGMLEAMINLIPTARVGHIGLYRDHDTLEPVDYYRKMPKDMAGSRVFIIDPMLATGGSASAAIQYIKNYGCKDIKLLCIIAAPEGAARIAKDHPDVNVYAAAMDEKLNEIGYIMPGLGDAGDRIFGTI